MPVEVRDWRGPIVRDFLSTLKQRVWRHTSVIPAAKKLSEDPVSATADEKEATEAAKLLSVTSKFS